MTKKIEEEIEIIRKIIKLYFYWLITISTFLIWTNIYIITGGITP